MAKISNRKDKRVVLKVSSKKQQPKSIVVKSVRNNSKYNLLVTFNPNRAKSAETELVDVLAKIGEEPKIAATMADGVYKLRVSNSRKVTERLQKLCQADPDLFVETCRYIPIDIWCKSLIKSMQSRIKKLVQDIGDRERWKLSLNKRFWNKLDDKKLILKLTDVIDRSNTDLEKPEKIVQVEIIGKDAGISLLTPKEILNISRTKASS